MMTKLHLILVFTVVSVALYMYFLYKEIKVFQLEVQTIKKQVHSILNAPQEVAMCHVTAVPTAPSVSEPVVSQQQLIEDQLEQVEDDPELVMNNDDPEDDSVSVTSNDIKEILTNIQDTEEQSTTSPIEPQIVSDFTCLSEEELNRHTYIELRDFLKKNGQPGKGSKQNLIDRVLALNKNNDAK